MSKQDRQGVRTPQDLERKYNFSEYEKLIKKLQDELKSKSDSDKIKIERLSNEIEQLKAEDTGWVDCELDSKFEQYDTSKNPLQIRKIGKVVHLRGVIKPTEDISLTDDSLDAITAISGTFAPANREVFICQGSGTNSFALHIDSITLLDVDMGIVSISNYSDSTTINETIPKGECLNCFATWFVN